MIAAAIRAIRDWRIRRLEAYINEMAEAENDATFRGDFEAADAFAIRRLNLRSRLYRLEDAGRGVVAS